MSETRFPVVRRFGQAVCLSLLTCMACGGGGSGLPSSDNAAAGRLYEEAGVVHIPLALTTPNNHDNFGHWVPLSLDGKVLSPGETIETLWLEIAADALEVGKDLPASELPPGTTLVWRIEMEPPDAPGNPGCAVSEAHNHEGDAMCGPHLRTDRLRAGDGTGDFVVHFDKAEIEAGSALKGSIRMTRWQQPIPGGPTYYCCADLHLEVDAAINDGFDLVNLPTEAWHPMAGYCQQEPIQGECASGG